MNNTMLTNLTTQMKWSNSLKNTSVKTTQEDIDNLNRSISIKEIKSIIDNLLKQETPGSDMFISEFY